LTPPARLPTSRTGQVHGVTGTAPTDADVALRWFARRERGFLDMTRMERLDAELRRSGPQAVRRNRWRSIGTKADIELADGTRLRLWLFWQASGVIHAIERAFFHDEIGWIVLVRRDDGELLRLGAHRIRVDPAPASGVGLVSRRS
jgi:hypothetical protein